MSERRERAGHNQRRAIEHEPHKTLVLRRDLRGVRVRHRRVIGLHSQYSQSAVMSAMLRFEAALAFLSAVRHCTPRCAKDIVGIALCCNMLYCVVHAAVHFALQTL